MGRPGRDEGNAGQHYNQGAGKPDGKLLGGVLCILYGGNEKKLLQGQGVLSNKIHGGENLPSGL